MNASPPQHILCAVRGRPESRSTVSYAIKLALEYEARLTFLHILDADFLVHAPGSSLSVVYQELSSMGEFAMLILVDRALRRGVKVVDYAIREGNIRKQLRQFALETQADVLVVGEPKLGPGRNIFSPQEFVDFIQILEKDAHLRVIQVSPSDHD